MGTVHNQAEMKIYKHKNRENPRDPKLTSLIVYGTIEASGGDSAPDGVLIYVIKIKKFRRRRYGIIPKPIEFV
jgi:hypothetical protein